jgi:hypothetical protein
MSYEMKALAPGHAAGFIRKPKRLVTNPRTPVVAKKEGRASSLDRGTLFVSPQEFDDFQKCMTNPEKPTQKLMQGAELLRSLFSKTF